MRILISILLVVMSADTDQYYGDETEGTDQYSADSDDCRY